MKLYNRWQIDTSRKKIGMDVVVVSYTHPNMSPFLQCLNKASGTHLEFSSSGDVFHSLEGFVFL